MRRLASLFRLAFLFFGVFFLCLAGELPVERVREALRQLIREALGKAVGPSPDERERQRRRVALANASTQLVPRDRPRRAPEAPLGDQTLILEPDPVPPQEKPVPFSPEEFERVTAEVNAAGTAKLAALDERPVRCSGRAYPANELRRNLAFAAFAALRGVERTKVRKRDLASFDEYLARVPPIPDWPADWADRFPMVALVDDLALEEALGLLRAENRAYACAELEEGYVRRRSPYWIRCADRTYAKADVRRVLAEVALDEQLLFAREGLFLATQYPEIFARADPATGSTVERDLECVGVREKPVTLVKEGGTLLLEMRYPDEAHELHVLVRGDLPTQHG